MQSSNVKLNDFRDNSNANVALCTKQINISFTMNHIQVGFGHWNWYNLKICCFTLSLSNNKSLLKQGCFNLFKFSLVQVTQV